MLLEELRIDRFTERVSHSPWGLGDPKTARRHFFDSEHRLFVKIWEPEYQHASRHWQGRMLVDADVTGLFGFGIGFFDAELGSAFVDVIEDQEGNLRGYVTRAGTPLNGRGDAGFKPFLDCVKKATADTGYAHTDFCHNNLVIVEGRISFIDFDTLFTDLRYADIECEREKGALRPHVYQEYRDFVEGMLTSQTDPASLL